MPNLKSVGLTVFEFNSAQKSSGKKERKKDRKKEIKTRTERFARKQICLCV